MSSTMALNSFPVFISAYKKIKTKMALIMKYIDSMHHYMDKYGGEYPNLFVRLQCIGSINVNCPCAQQTHQWGSSNDLHTLFLRKFMMSIDALQFMTSLKAACNHVKLTCWKLKTLLSIEYNWCKDHQMMKWVIKSIIFISKRMTQEKKVVGWLLHILSGNSTYLLPDHYQSISGHWHKCKLKYFYGNPTANVGKLHCCFTFLCFCFA